MTSIAIIDVETTGLNPYRHDSIVELAALVIRPDGTVLRTFETLINPDRDIGPTRLHGLSTCDVLAAPRFGEIAGALLEVLDGCIAIAGHNVHLDHSFLTVEFDRLGYAFPDGPTLCTMRLAGGGSLASACSDYGITVEGEAHTALHDVRAAAKLLAALLKDAVQLRSKISRWPPIIWPDVPKTAVQALTRDVSRQRETEPPTYLQKLLTRVQPDIPSDDENSAALAYTALLDRLLEDRCVDEREGQALVDLATRWSIPGDQIQKIHTDYLLRLGAAALADGVVTDAERRDLHQVAVLLGKNPRSLDGILESAMEKLTEVQTQSSVGIDGMGSGPLVGRQVCFTGECQCRLRGETITREMAVELAARRGMIVAEAVTKKLDFLVVADPLTQSGKAKKARQYGIRIMHEPVFWRALGLEVG